MAPRRRFAVLAAIVAPLLAACPESSLGPEFREISEAESGLQFYAPGLEGGYRNILRGADARYNQTTSAVFGPRQGEFPQGYLLFVELRPDMHYTRKDPLRRSIKQWQPFEQKAITHGAEGVAVNAIGRIEYLTFQADAVACVIFQQFFGRVDDGGVGNRMLAGYYCKGEGPMMGRDEAASIVKLVGHRNYGAVRPPEGWAAAAGSMKLRDLPIDVDWADAGRFKMPIGGVMSFADIPKTGAFTVLKGELRTEPGPHGKCEGGFQLNATKEQTFAGEWFLLCADGVSAKGSMVMGRGDGGPVLTGTGADSEKRSVTLSQRT